MRSPFGLARRGLCSIDAPAFAELPRRRRAGFIELRDAAWPVAHRGQLTPTRCSTRTSPTRRWSKRPTVSITPMRRRARSAAGGSTSSSPARATWSIGSISATRFRPSPAGRRRPRTSGRRTSPATATLYYLYYSAKPDAALSDDKRGLCLAVATAGGPLGRSSTWASRSSAARLRQHRPDGVRRSGDRQAAALLGLGLQADQGAGAGPDRMSFAPGSKPLDLVRPVKSDDPAEYRELIEGAWVIHRGGWYYLFYSGDNCCGPKAHYAVLVARSRSATGPFETLTDAPASRHHPRAARQLVRARPQCDHHRRGRRRLDGLSRGRCRRPRTKPTDDVNTRRIMLIDRIVWRDGWPRIEGNGPSAEPKRRPRVR